MDFQSFFIGVMAVVLLDVAAFIFLFQRIKPGTVTVAKSFDYTIKW